MLKKYQKHYNNGYTLKETAEKFNTTVGKIRYKIKTRNRSECAKLQRLKQPNPSDLLYVRKKISNSMKIAIKEGRAKGWNNLPRYKRKRSYPEKFFEKVIKNEFEDKNYIFEYPISIYSIDFAWPHKKLAIEIDGKQHEHKDRKAIDKRKDKLLNERNWKILRIKWIDIFNEPKKQISLAKKFINEAPVVLMVT